MSITKRITAAFLAALLFGCAQQGGHNPSYFGYQERIYPVKAPGTVAVVMTASQQSEIYSGKPSSLTGGATTLTLPIGQITREAARIAAGAAFEGGSKVIEAKQNRGYTAQITPRITNFRYEYNQLKNLGFAITPTVDLTLAVEIFTETGEKRDQLEYTPGPHEGPAYAIAISAGEEISKAAHVAIMRSMQLAIDDLHRRIISTPRETLNPRNSQGAESHQGRDTKAQPMPNPPAEPTQPPKQPVLEPPLREQAL